MSDRNRVNGRVYGRGDLKWRDRQLRLTTGRLLATIEPDSNFAGMFRVRLPNGHLTDMVNLTRAKDAAISMALTALNNFRTQARRCRQRRWTSRRPPPPPRQGRAVVIRCISS
jgi:hypothetical protein